MRTFSKQVLGVSIAAIVFATVPAIGAQLNFIATPASQAAAEMDDALHTKIVFEPGVNANRTVSFQVADLARPGARTYAVSSLARALGATFTKTFVISRIPKGTTPTAPAIDDNAVVGFAHKTLPAAEAIRMIASVDKSSAEFDTRVYGVINFGASQLPARQAAADVARQTHTIWYVVYRLTNPAEARLYGKIIGYTAGGQPITEEPSYGTSLNPPATSSAPMYAHRQIAPAPAQVTVSPVVPVPYVPYNWTTPYTGPPMTPVSPYRYYVYPYSGYGALGNVLIMPGGAAYQPMLIGP